MDFSMLTQTFKSPPSAHFQRPVGKVGSQISCRFSGRRYHGKEVRALPRQPGNSSWENKNPAKQPRASLGFYPNCSSTSYNPKPLKTRSKRNEKNLLWNNFPEIKSVFSSTQGCLGGPSEAARGGKSVFHDFHTN